MGRRLDYAIGLYMEGIRDGHARAAITKYSVGLMARDQTLDISLARKRLGYAPRVQLDEGLRNYFAHLSQRKPQN